jgi:hypothetical protein
VGAVGLRPRCCSLLLLPLPLSRCCSLLLLSLLLLMPLASELFKSAILLRNLSLSKLRTAGRRRPLWSLAVLELPVSFAAWETEMPGSMLLVFPPAAYTPKPHATHGRGGELLPDGKAGPNWSGPRKLGFGRYK